MGNLQARLEGLPAATGADRPQEFYKLYQRSGETTLNFVTRFRAAKARVENLAPHEELHVFVTALPPKLRMEVERDGDLDTAIKLALRLANVYEMDNRRPTNYSMGRERLGDEIPRYYDNYQGDNKHSYDGATPMELGMVTSPDNMSGNMQPNNRANRDNGRGNGGNRQSRRSGPPQHGYWRRAMTTGAKAVLLLPPARPPGRQLSQLSRRWPKGRQRPCQALL